MEDAQYHELRARQEQAAASNLPPGDARERHEALAGLHLEKAQSLRETESGEPLTSWAQVPPLRSGSEDSIWNAVRQSRDLIAESQRILAESRKKVPTKGSSTFP